MGACGIDMAEHSCIDELRRRVLLNPASIAFAALAEEYRRAGQYEDAIATCRIGLRRHPAYLPPRVTLARALFAIGRSDEAHAELERVLVAAADHVAARRALDEIDADEIRRLAPPLPLDAASRRADMPAVADPALTALEAFLAAIQRVQAAGHPVSPADR